MQPSSAASSPRLPSPVQSAATLLDLEGELPRVSYAFHTQGDANAAWMVASVDIDQRVSETYRVELELVSAQGDDASKLLGQPCSLVMRRADSSRCVHGMVSQVARSGSRVAEGALRVTVVPALEALRQRVDCRIFQDKTVPEVLDLVLGPALAEHRRKHQSKLRRGEYPRREYIVQYRESDLIFAERLMSEEGIWYYFEQSTGVGAEDCELLTLVDSNDEAPEAALASAGKVLPLELEPSDVAWQAVYELGAEQHLGASQVAVATHNWSHPSVAEAAAEPADGVAARARYEPHGVALWAYADQRYTRSDAQDQARLRWEQHHGRAEGLHGKSNVMELAVGQRVTVQGASAQLDGEWIITLVHAWGRDTRQSERTDGRADYTNTFRARRYEVPLRPAHRGRPRAVGFSLAHVVGPDGKPVCPANGDDIHTDEHGRVRVKMSWDRTVPGAADATITCFLRVAQLWSGAGWGALFLPRIGMEVLVGFVDGDPDQPLVTGCVYNGLARTPLTLPDDKTKSYIRTQSSPGGEGYNELQFDDAAGSELVALRAQRDHREHVLNDQTITVAAKRSESVGGAETVVNRGTRTHTVHGAETLRVVDGSARLLDLSGDDTKLIAKNRELVVSEKTRETHVGGRSVVVQAVDKLEVADGAHKHDHVTGQYNIIADEHFKLRQGGDELYMKDAFYVASQGSVQLKNAGFHLRANPDGSTTLDVGKELTIRVGSAQIQLKSDGTVSVSGSREATVYAGASKLALTPAGATLGAPQAALTGKALVELTAPIIKLN